MPFFSSSNSRDDRPEGLIALGRFRFSVDKATYQQLRIQSDYKWAEIKRVGRDAALQFSGVGVQTETFDGVLYPQTKKEGYTLIPELRAEADKGIKLMMVDSLGDVLGWWVIVSISEVQTKFTASGLPKKIEFSMTLKRHSR